MVNAQEWLDQNYPKEIRGWVYEIYLNKKLEGVLDLSSFEELWKVYISRHLNESELEIANPREEVEIVKTVGAQEYINEEYPTKESRTKVSKLDISDKNLEGELELDDFVNLKYLDCGANVLTSLGLSDCTNLEELLCYENHLTNLDVSGLINLKTVICQNNRLISLNYPISNPEKLININVANNNLSEQKISIFNKYPNLERLIIGSDIKKREIQNIYNRFSGSLKDLKNLKNLRLFNIESTDVSSGLEYLPNALEKISCTGELSAQLKNYLLINDKMGVYYDYSAWREDNLDLIKQIQMNEKLMIILKIIKNTLGRRQKKELGQETFISEPPSQAEKVFDALCIHLADELRTDKKNLCQDQKLESNIETSQFPKISHTNF